MAIIIIEFSRNPTFRGAVDMRAEIEVVALWSAGPGRLVLCMADGMRLAKALGPGYADRDFHLVAGGMRFLNCAVVEAGERYKIAFGGVAESMIA